MKKAWADVYEELGRKDESRKEEEEEEEEDKEGEDEKEEGNAKEAEDREGRTGDAELWNEIEEEEYERAKAQLVTGRASGIDEVEEVFIKKGGSAMRSMLIDLYNCILKAKSVPEQWKLGLIFPIY